MDETSDLLWDDFDCDFEFVVQPESDVQDKQPDTSVSINKMSSKNKLVKSGSKSVQKIASSTALVKRRAKENQIFETKLYAFPIFEKSSALKYLPSTYARLINPGELDKLAKLMKTYCQKDCDVTLHPTFNVSIPHYLQLLDYVDKLRPDIMYCTHSSKLVGNQIQAVLYHKYTDTPEMHHYADTIVDLPEYKYYFVGNRIDILKRNLRTIKMTEEKRKEILALLYLEEELQVYGKVDLTITFDGVSKKIVEMQYINSYTSISYDGVQYPFD